MKTKIMKKHFLFFVVLIVLVSCKKTRLENNVYFEEPQPINNKELTKIPSKFIGTFLHNDSVYLNIDEHLVTYLNNYKIRIHKSELDSLKEKLVYIDGKFIEKKTHKVLENTSFGDSIEFNIKEIDTVFKFSDNQKAKRSNGKLILSTRDSVHWQIKILTLDKNIITVQELSADTDVKAIDSITKTKAQVIAGANYIARPSRREFSRILKLKKLGSSKSFKKIK